MYRLTIVYFVLHFFIKCAFSLAFTTRCWETLNEKENLLKDAACQNVNQTSTNGWHTTEPDDWVYYPQQYVNVSITAAQVSIALVGGCCAPKRNKPTGFLYQDDGSTYQETGNKIVAISDRPLVQNLSVTGWYLKNFVDDGAVNLTFIPTVNHPDKQSILYEAVAFDRAMLVNYFFYDSKGKLLSNISTGVVRKKVRIQDITLPKYTRTVKVAIYSSRADPMCFSYLHASLYVYSPFTTLTKICKKMELLLQYIALGNFVVIPIVYFLISYTFGSSFPPPTRFLCRTPSNKIHMCIIVMLGSFISNQAWNMLNSESTMFHEWLPRAARIIELFLSFLLYAVYFYPLFLSYNAGYKSRLANMIGAYLGLALFGLRLSIDIPIYVILYARSPGFLSIILITTIPTITAFVTVILYFTTRTIRFSSCILCNMKLLEVEDIEEKYVLNLMKKRKAKKATVKLNTTTNIKRNHDSFSGKLWETLASIKKTSSFTSSDVFHLLKKITRWIFGINKHVRIPFAIKSSITLLIYCLTQLIPLLLLRMIGTGGAVPTYICLWSPYLVQLHYKKDPLKFAIRTFYLMRIVVYLATMGGGMLCIAFSLGILKRFTKDILRIRNGDYSLVKGKRHNRIDVNDAIRFLGVFVGFGFTGTLYTMIEISLIGTFITMFVQLDIAREFLLKQVGYGAYFASFLIAIVVQYIQKRVTNLIFVEPRTRFVAHHRAPFLHYWYFMMLTSMTRALTSYFLRTLKSVIRYPIYSLRVDRNAETWSVRNGDAGFTAYCGMLLADHEYNNPIVITFIECILDCMESSIRKNIAEIDEFLYKNPKSLCSTHSNKYNITDEEKSDNTGNMRCGDNSKIDYISHSLRDTYCPEQLNNNPLSKRARTRWFLAYTLLHNPQV